MRISILESFMRICILDPSYSQSESDMKNYDDRTFIGEYLESLGHSFETHEIHKATAVKQIRTLVKSGKYDVFLNICDGAWDDDTAGFEVVQTLEHYNVPFTGADSRFYDPTREEMKLVCDAWGVKVPGYIITSDIADIDLAVKLLQFPLIVKHFQSYSSIGLHKESRIETPEQLKQQTIRMLEEYGEVLIEEFIDGREFTVLVAENPDNLDDPIAYSPIEFKFPANEGKKGFKHFEMKWIDFHQMSENCVQDAVLEQKLKELSKKVFLGLNGTGYGRCDIRMDEKGELYLLEINPNCGVFYSKQAPGSADFILLHDNKGHIGFVDTILHAAYNRVKKPHKWRIIFSKSHGFGIFANQEIKPGEVIIQYEEKPHYLITKSYMEKHLNTREKEWFPRYAYPISDEVWAFWSDKPKEWIPINHSCDPNAWLEGLNMIARRVISPGTEITMEYATFMNELMPSFACDCKSKQCRKTIHGSDYQHPSMDIFEGHFSDYIAHKRKDHREKK